MTFSTSEVIPETIGNLVNLERLSLSANEITSLPETFRNLKKVEFMYLYTINTTNLPEVLLDLPSLFNLILDGEICKIALQGHELDERTEYIGYTLQKRGVYFTVP